MKTAHKNLMKKGKQNPNYNLFSVVCNFLFLLSFAFSAEWFRPKSSLMKMTFSRERILSPSHATGNNQWLLYHVTRTRNINYETKRNWTCKCVKTGMTWYQLMWCDSNLTKTFSFTHIAIIVSPRWMKCRRPTNNTPLIMNIEVSTDTVTSSFDNDAGWTSNYYRFEW